MFSAGKGEIDHPRDKFWNGVRMNIIYFMSLRIPQSPYKPIWMNLQVEAKISGRFVIRAEQCLKKPLH